MRDHSCAIGAQRFGGAIRVVVENHRLVMLERVRRGGVRSDPFEPVLIQPELAERRRRYRHWMDRGTYVMHETRHREFRGAETSACRVARLDHERRQPSPGGQGRGGEPVRPGADDYHVVARVGHVQTIRPRDALSQSMPQRANFVTKRTSRDTYDV